MKPDSITQFKFDKKTKKLVTIQNPDVNIAYQDIKFKMLLAAKGIVQISVPQNLNNDKSDVSVDKTYPHENKLVGRYASLPVNEYSMNLRLIKKTCEYYYIFSSNTTS